jgi:hypothetical protein
MTVEPDDYGEFHVGGVCDDGKPDWGISTRLERSNQDGPPDHEYRVVEGRSDRGAEGSEKEAVLALIQQWGEKLPLLVASPIKA